MRRIWGIGLLVLLALAVLLWWRTPWGDRLQAYSFDSLQILSPRKIESLPVTIVAIDDKSIAALGQWPWPRTELAELVRAVARQQPAAIGIDVLMPEPDRLSPQRMLERVGALDPAIERTVRALPSNDAMLAQAIGEAPVVLVAAGVPEATGRALHAPPFIVTGSGTPPLPRLGGVVPNIEMLDAKAAGHGLISVEPSNTMFRRFALVADVNGTLAPALSIEMLRVALGVPTLRLHVRGRRGARHLRRQGVRADRGRRRGARLLLARRRASLCVGDRRPAGQGAARRAAQEARADRAHRPRPARRLSPDRARRADARQRDPRPAAREPVRPDAARAADVGAAVRACRLHRARRAADLVHPATEAARRRGARARLRCARARRRIRRVSHRTPAVRRHARPEPDALLRRAAAADARRIASAPQGDAARAAGAARALRLRQRANSRPHSASRPVCCRASPRCAPTVGSTSRRR